MFLIELCNSQEFVCDLSMNMWAWMSFYKFIWPHPLSKVWKSTCSHSAWICVFAGGGCRVKMRLLWEDWSAKALRFIKSCRSRLPLSLSLIPHHCCNTPFIVYTLWRDIKFLPSNCNHYTAMGKGSTSLRSKNTHTLTQIHAHAHFHTACPSN